MVCGDSLYCDITDLEAICGEILEERGVLTNEIFRKKRGTEDEQGLEDTSEEMNLNETMQMSNVNQIIKSSLSMDQSIGQRRHLIEIVFKLVGNKAPVSFRLCYIHL